jgi:hypothetical protein
MEREVREIHSRYAGNTSFSKTTQITYSVEDNDEDFSATPTGGLA